MTVWRFCTWVSKLAVRYRGVDLICILDKVATLSTA